MVVSLVPVIPVAPRHLEQFEDGKIASN